MFQRLLCREGLKELIMETPELIEKVINESVTIGSLMIDRLLLTDN